MSTALVALFADVNQIDRACVTQIDLKYLVFTQELTSI